jgi:hypothetical protein
MFIHFCMNNMLIHVDASFPLLFSHYVAMKMELWLMCLGSLAQLRLLDGAPVLGALTCVGATAVVFLEVTSYTAWWQWLNAPRPRQRVSDSSYNLSVSSYQLHLPGLLLFCSELLAIVPQLYHSLFHGHRFMDDLDAITQLPAVKSHFSIHITGFDAFLSAVCTLLPCCQQRVYEWKNFLSALSMPYDKIDACPNESESLSYMLVCLMSLSVRFVSYICLLLDGMKTWKDRWCPQLIKRTGYCKLKELGCFFFIFITNWLVRYHGFQIVTHPSRFGVATQKRSSLQLRVVATRGSSRH